MLGLFNGIGHLAQSAERGDAVKEIRPAVIRLLRLTEHVERAFVISADRLELVTRYSRMKVDAAVVIDKVERHGVRVALIAEHRQHPALLGTEDTFAFFICQLLFEAPHFSEHKFPFRLSHEDFALS